MVEEHIHAFVLCSRVAALDKGIGLSYNTVNVSEVFFCVRRKQAERHKRGRLPLLHRCIIKTKEDIMKYIVMGNKKQEGCKRNEREEKFADL